MNFKEFLHELRYAMSNKRNTVAQQMEADLYERDQLLDTLRKSIDTTAFHAEINPGPGLRNCPVVPTTISREYYETLERLGASPKFLNKLKPIVRD